MAQTEHYHLGSNENKTRPLAWLRRYTTTAENKADQEKIPKTFVVIREST